MSDTTPPAPLAPPAPLPDQEQPASAFGPPLPETPPEAHSPAPAPHAPETGGPPGPEPTRYGDWERKGIAVDF